MASRSTRERRRAAPPKTPVPPPGPRLGRGWWVAVVMVALVGLVILRYGRKPPVPEQRAERPAQQSEHARALERLRALASAHASAAQAQARQPERPAAAAEAAEAIDDDERSRRENQHDPVASLIPLLAGQTPEQQLAYLKWARRLPEGGYVAVFPDLVGARDIEPGERTRLGGDALDGLIEQLEAQGVRVAELPADVKPVQVVDNPPPVEMPPSLRETYKPFPGDPYRHDPVGSAPPPSPAAP
jgi:hypothetical protein